MTEEQEYDQQLIKDLQHLVQKMKMDELFHEPSTYEDELEED